MFYQKLYDAADADLFLAAEGLEPSGEFVSALNLPCQGQLCHRRHYASRVILW